MNKEESVLCPNCFKEEVNSNDRYNCKHCGTPLKKWDIKEHTPQLDSDVEKILNSTYSLLKLIPKGYHRKQKNGCIVLLEKVLDDRLGRIKGNTLNLQQHISNQQSKLDKIKKVIEDDILISMINEEDIHYSDISAIQQILKEEKK